MNAIDFISTWYPSDHRKKKAQKLKKRMKSKKKRKKWYKENLEL